MCRGAWDAGGGRRGGFGWGGWGGWGGGLGWKGWGEGRERGGGGGGTGGVAFFDSFVGGVWAGRLSIGFWVLHFVVAGGNIFGAKNRLSDDLPLAHQLRLFHEVRALSTKRLLEV